MKSTRVCRCFSSNLKSWMALWDTLYCFLAGGGRGCTDAVSSSCCCCSSSSRGESSCPSTSTSSMTAAAGTFFTLGRGMLDGDAGRLVEMLFGWWSVAD